MDHGNGFFGQVRSPFIEGDQIFNVIQEQCQPYIVDYINKIGIHVPINYNFDINQQTLTVLLNSKEFKIGKTGMLQLEDVKIKSIVFPKNIDNCYIDYQYIEKA